MINVKQTLYYINVSIALVNYEVRRKDKQSCSKSTSAEALTVRRMSFRKKGRDDRDRSKSILGFKDLKKN